ncbi:MAG: SRPBCC family protein [Acidimicrobiales bacterium]|nr:SRPBCC family protein [Acidimicrobiales bacterium]
MNREIADHDLAISAGQQLGLSSRGYRGVRLAGQEGRVQRFHDVLGEYLDGFRP